MANSYPQTKGPSINLQQPIGTYPQQDGPSETVDTLLFARIRINGFIQRTGLNEGLLAGKVYNDTGNPVTLNTVDISIAGEGGPWVPCNILLSDPAFSFPAIGIAGGTAFVVPIGISVVVEGSVNFKIEMSY